MREDEAEISILQIGDEEHHPMFMYEVEYEEEGQLVCSLDLVTSKNRAKVCAGCGGVLFNVYIYIIDCLKEAGLLDKDYELLCCECYEKRKIAKKLLGGVNKWEKIITTK